MPPVPEARIRPVGGRTASIKPHEEPRHSVAPLEGMGGFILPSRFSFPLTITLRIINYFN